MAPTLVTQVAARTAFQRAWQNATSFASGARLRRSWAAAPPGFPKAPSARLLRAASDYPPRRPGGSPLSRENARRRRWLRGWGRGRGAGVACALLLALTWHAPHAGAASEGELAASRAVVDELHDSLLRSMHAGGGWSFDARRTELEPVLRRSFDFAFMAEKSVGRYWAGLASEERSALIETMARLASANYASRFRSYDGEGFEVSRVEPASHNTTLVRSRITRADGEPVALDYRLRADAAGQPRIIDVFLDGTVSELALRRAEYSSVIGREGFDALLDALRDKIEVLASAPQ